MAIPQLGRRQYAIVGTALVAFVFLAWLRSGAAATEFGSGTITAIDTAGRLASIEVVIPSTGATRELTGTIPDHCLIEIDGKTAALSDLRVGEHVSVAAKIERNIAGPNGKRSARFTVEHVRAERTAADRL